MARGKGLREIREFAGYLGIDDKETAITFKAHVNDAGEVVFDFAQVPLSDGTKFIVDAWYSANVGPPYFRLRGVAADQVTLQTDHLYFSSIGPHSSAERGAYFSFVAEATDVTFRIKSSVVCEKPILTYWFRGFRCFPRVVASSDIGRLTAGGDAQCKDARKLSGHISVQCCDVPADTQKWRREAEQLLDHVRRVMSFAEGVYLSDPVLEFRSGAAIEMNVQSRSVQGGFAVPTFHMMDRDAIFQSAVRSFSAPQHRVENLPMALEWMSMTASYKEARLVNAMTALENLVSSNTRDLADLLEKKEFNKLDKLLKPVIKQFVGDRGRGHANASLVKELSTKLLELRRRSLKVRLQALLERWSVPIDGISDQMITEAFSARNNIIHEGQYYVDGKQQLDLRQHIGVVREIATRMIFCALGFQGRYTSHLGGYHDATFPPQV